MGIYGIIRSLSCRALSCVLVVLSCSHPCTTPVLSCFIFLFLLSLSFLILYRPATRTTKARNLGHPPLPEHYGEVDELNFLLWLFVCLACGDLKSKETP